MPAAPPGADYLLPRSISPLIIYDATLQPVEQPERAGIVEGAPLRILNEDDRMSDGITPCLRVSLAGRVFFLVRAGRDGKGDPATASRAFVVYGATPLDDTVLVLHSSAVRFTPATAPPVLLAQNTRVERVFQEGKRIYGRILPANSYGWFDFEPNARVFGPVDRAVALQRPDGDMERTIRTQLNNVNLVLHAAYDRMGRRAGRRLPIPRWDLVAEENRWVCVLSNAADPSGHDESSGLLTRALQRSVRAWGRTVSAEPGRIVIQ
jgi:hypothetical protein